jgi:hypothetical protein
MKRTSHTELGLFIILIIVFFAAWTNAAQAMEDTGGILEVGLRDVELNEQSSLPLLELKSGNYMKITVSDTPLGSLAINRFLNQDRF